MQPVSEANHQNMVRASQDEQLRVHAFLYWPTMCMPGSLGASHTRAFRLGVRAPDSPVIATQQVLIEPEMCWTIEFCEHGVQSCSS